LKKRNLSLIFLVTFLIVFTFVSFGLAGNAQGEEKPLVRASHQPCLHGLPSWMAIEDGWVKESPIDMEFIYLPDGPAQNEALGAKQWDVGAMGTVPCLMAGLRYGAYMVGVSNDESETNDIWVRPDSPLLETKGWNPDYPDIYGTQEDWKGKKILASTTSTGHYALSSTLKALGLKDNDVAIVHMEQSQAIPAFESGQGDIVQLWAPFSYMAEEKGWVKVSSGARAGATIPGAIIVRKEFADEHPDLVVEWLDLYMRGVEYMENNPDESLDWLYKYFNDFCGLQLKKELLTDEFKLRPLFNVEEQIELLENPEKVGKWMAGIAQFFVDQGVLTPEEKEEYITGGYIEPKFMKMLYEKRGQSK
jgi:sulfonate transport system substrate-binding protein